MILGKDGKPFDKARYIDWALKGRSSMTLRPLNEQPRKRVIASRVPRSKLKTLDELLRR